MAQNCLLRFPPVRKFCLVPPFESFASCVLPIATNVTSDTFSYWLDLALFPGAALMAAKAATRSGVGLLTAFVPESLQPSFAAALPEAMWVPMPETPDGGLALEGRALVVEKLSRATALVAGPGLGTERETQVLLSEILKAFDGPAVLDADALQPEIYRRSSQAREASPYPPCG